MTESQKDLAAYATAALKAGVEERRVAVAESQGAQLAQVVRGILDRLNLTPAQLELVPSVVTEQFRALTLTEGA